MTSSSSASASTTWPTCADAGVTIVVVTHGMGTVETMCDGAAWLDHGVLQMVGAAGDVASAYLRRVNEREAEDRATEAAAAAEAAAVAAGSTYVPDSEAWFGEDMEILDVFFTGADGERITAGTTGETAGAQHRLPGAPPVEDPVFGYQIHTENDTPVSGTNTRLCGMETGVLSGDGLVRDGDRPTSRCCRATTSSPSASTTSSCSTPTTATTGPTRCRSGGGATRRRGVHRAAQQLDDAAVGAARSQHGHRAG